MFQNYLSRVNWKRSDNSAMSFGSSSTIRRHASTSACSLLPIDLMYWNTLIWNSKEKYYTFLRKKLTSAFLTPLQHLSCFQYEITSIYHYVKLGKFELDLPFSSEENIFVVLAKINRNIVGVHNWSTESVHLLMTFSKLSRWPLLSFSTYKEVKNRNFRILLTFILAK